MRAVVYGPTAAMGSKKGFLNPRSGRVQIVDDKKAKLRSFQSEMRAAMQDTAPETPHLGAIHVEIVFCVSRPKGHFGTGKNASKLKEAAPDRPTTKPDVDKVARAVLDCGTGLWYRDDAQIVTLEIRKYYTAKQERTEVSAKCIEERV